MYCFVVVVVVVVVAVRKNKNKHTKNGRLSCMAVSRGKVQLGLRGSCFSDQKCNVVVMSTADITCLRRIIS